MKRALTSIVPINQSPAIGRTSLMSADSFLSTPAIKTTTTLRISIFVFLISFLLAFIGLKISPVVDPNI